MSGSLSSGNCVCTTGRRKRTTTLPTTTTIIFGNSQGRRELSLVTRVRRGSHVQCCVSAMERTTKQIPHTWIRYCNDNEPMTRSYWQIIKRRHKRLQLGEGGDTSESNYDNTAVLKSHLLIWLLKYNIEQVQHFPYFPDASPCDFRLFSRLEAPHNNLPNNNHKNVPIKENTGEGCIAFQNCGIVKGARFWEKHVVLFGARCSFQTNSVWCWILFFFF